jgi:hypothetical protein
MAAFVIGTKDQNAPNAGLPHLSECDFLGALHRWHQSAAGSAQQIINPLGSELNLLRTDGHL